MFSRNELADKITEANKIYNDAEKEQIEMREYDPQVWGKIKNLYGSAYSKYLNIQKVSEQLMKEHLITGSQYSNININSQLKIIACRIQSLLHEYPKDSTDLCYVRRKLNKLDEDKKNMVVEHEKAFSSIGVLPEDYNIIWDYTLCVCYGRAYENLANHLARSNQNRLLNALNRYNKAIGYYEKAFNLNKQIRPELSFCNRQHILRLQERRRHMREAHDMWSHTGKTIRSIISETGDCTRNLSDSQKSDFCTELFNQFNQSIRESLVNKNNQLSVKDKGEAAGTLFLTRPLSLVKCQSLDDFEVRLNRLLTEVLKEKEDGGVEFMKILDDKLKKQMSSWNHCPKQTTFLIRQ